MKIRFRYFWNSFDPSHNIFINIINEIFQNENNYKSITIEFHSVFVRPRRLSILYISAQIRFRKLLRSIFRRKVIYVWYTGEIIKPPKGYDITLSYWPTTLNNIYWPLWATYIDHPPRNSKFDRAYAPTMRELISKRPSEKFSGRRWKACAFISNPADERLKIARVLELEGLLDIYGRAVGKPVPVKSKIACNYAFQFCFENTIQRGYVSEKPIEAWLDGTIPIYCGGNEERYLNSKALIDCTNLTGQHLVDFVKQSMQYELEAPSRSSEPILLKAYDYDDFIKAVSKIIHWRKY